MSNVLSILKVIPSSPEVDREDIVARAKNELSKGLNLEILKKEEEPLFFGLYAIKLFVKTPDSDEGTETLQTFENRLVSLDEVDNCEVELQTIIDY
ncbi:MAG: elongation factor 1-beta [Candidatus Heimdallarchaeota archaeon]|nr:elongation factor 1-beta [Candidatus Heimdallarchaeota archaeon]